MARWDEDDCWTDRDEPFPFEPIRSKRRAAEDEGPPEAPEPLVPVEDAFEGSVYWIADVLWEFTVPDRLAHPGVCVRCLRTAQEALLLKGTSVRPDRVWQYQRDEVFVVDPTPENGLDNPTAFGLDPRTVSLRILRRIHLDEGPRGRLSHEVFWKLQTRLADMERAFAEDPS